MFSELQKRTAQAIVNIFETGRPLGDYGRVTLMAGDNGHLTYGRSQTTLGSGNLYLLIRDYCGATGAEFADALRLYLERLASRDFTLDADVTFRGLLREAGDDPTMREVQDGFFDRVYWNVAVQRAANVGVSRALSTTVVYDSTVHGSWPLVESLTSQRHGTVAAIGENAWISAYVDERRGWLATNANALLQRTVYRMEAFAGLIEAAKWDLGLPLRIRGVLIDQEALQAPASVRVSAQSEDEGTLLLQEPRMRGAAVEAVQRALLGMGIRVEVDGIYGPDTETAVRQFQGKQGLKVDGIVGLATRSALGL